MSSDQWSLRDRKVLESHPLAVQQFRVDTVQGHFAVNDFHVVRVTDTLRIRWARFNQVDIRERGPFSHYALRGFS